MTAPTLPPAAPEGVEGQPLSLPQRIRGIRPRLRSTVTIRTPWALGLLAAAWAAAIGLMIAVIPMLVAWMTSTSSTMTWTESVLLGAGLWVIAQGAPLTVAGVAYSLLPWGLVLVPALLLGYGAAWAARRSGVVDVRGAVLVVVPGALGYAVAVGVVAAVTGAPTAYVPPVLAAAHGLALALVAMGWGSMRAAGCTLDRALPAWLAVAVRAGLVAAAALVGVGALAATASLLAHLDDAMTMVQALGAGLGGGLALTALGVAYVPVLALWGTSYVVGAGVIVGPGVTVSPFIGALPPTDLPPFPLLAALPQGATPLAWLLPVTGILAGVLAGVVIARRAREEQRLQRLAVAGLAAVVSGAVLGAGAALATGSLGDERLAHVGPTPLAVAILSAVLVALGAVPSAVAPSPSARPRLSVLNEPGDQPSAATVDDDRS